MKVNVIKYRSILIALLIIGAYSIKVFAQTHVSVSVNQPTQLIVNVDLDTTIPPGESVLIGGNPTASGGSGAYIYNWQPAGSLDNNSISNPLATPASGTTYNLIVTDANNCTTSGEANVRIEGQTEVKSIDLASDVLAVFPVPAYNLLHIEMNNIKGRYNLEIISINGDKVKSEQNIDAESDYSIDVSKYKSGLYLLRICVDNNLIYHYKFIINK